MKAFTKTILAVTVATSVGALTSQSAFAKAKDVSILQDQMNQIALVAKTAVELEKANWSRTSFDLNAAFGVVYAQLKADAAPPAPPSGGPYLGWGGWGAPA